MDYLKRLTRARDEMTKRNIGLIYLTRGANLWYLTGVQRREPELTDSNAYGDYICGAYIGANDEFTLVGPRMGGASWLKEAEDKPYIKDVRIITETEKPKTVLTEVIQGFPLKGTGIAVDDRAWMKSGRLFQQVMAKPIFSLASDIITPMRMLKDQDEIALMKKVGAITDDVFREVVPYLKVGLTEYDVAHEVDYHFTKRGAQFNSFVTSVRFTSPQRPRPITAPRSSPRKLEKGDAITFDFGACYQGYCSDFGRTVFVGTPPREFIIIHDIVIEAQAAAIDSMVDGTITATGLDHVAREIIEKAGYGPYFMHRLGHGIGVTVHEPPFLYIPDETILRSRMTFTVEPSIRLLNSWGARVEDVVMVTGNGGVPFSKYSKELTVI